MTAPPPKRVANIYAQHRGQLAAQVRDIGIREFSRRSGLGAMLLSRYCSGGGADDAWTHYAVAAALGRKLDLAPIDKSRVHVSTCLL